MMTGRSGSPDEQQRWAMGERAHLLNVGYRLLGSLVEAEDAVQEAYARWLALSPQQRAGIANPGAWLTTVTSRICLDLLRSARTRREAYVGDWIPEPLPGPANVGNLRPGEVNIDPADRITLDESVGMALMVVMESLTPAERVAFILHDVFGYPFAEVADIVGRSPGACRQLASSARARIRQSRGSTASPRRQAAVIGQFKRAWQAKDIGALVGLLDPSVVATADGGGRAITFRDPIEGRDQVIQAWLELADRVGDMAFVERTVNGQPGLVASQGGVVVTIFAFEVVDDRIRHIWAVRNPEKLRAWAS